ncbi:nuclear transport factor 2 family protein [Streptomyces sp. SID2563]|uniref:nuclear transport factor 2 family protein n=1 Tax=Streptomyces sp. SID2563 TaxID=2690255 RepID=UPI001F171D51|nr:nuclear transport factor 2 family protein [Streptomyces sp. SID2563]
MDRMDTTPDAQDHAEIAALISGFFRALDERRFEEGWADAYFTDDLHVTSPVGEATGTEAIRLAEESVGRFAATLHTSSDVLIHTTPDAHTADVTWNAHMTHVHRDSTLFTVGGVYEARFRRTEGDGGSAGWGCGRCGPRGSRPGGKPVTPVLVSKDIDRRCPPLTE